MSEQVQTGIPATTQPLQPVYLLYDPARRRRRARPRRVRRYEPDPLVVYEPRRRRRRARRLDPARAGSRVIVDGVVDGLGWGGLVGALPIPDYSINGGLTVKDVGAAVIAGVYEKLYMKRGWTPTLVGALVGLFANKMFSWLRGVR